MRKKLDGLSDDKLEEVRDYEKRNKNRKTLVQRLDGKLWSPFSRTPRSVHPRSGSTSS